MVAQLRHVSHRLQGLPRAEGKAWTALCLPLVGLGLALSGFAASGTASLPDQAQSIAVSHIPAPDTICTGSGPKQTCYRLYGVNAPDRHKCATLHRAGTRWLAGFAEGHRMQITASYGVTGGLATVSARSNGEDLAALMLRKGYVSAAGSGHLCET